MYTVNVADQAHIPVTPVTAGSRWTPQKHRHALRGSPSRPPQFTITENKTEVPRFKLYFGPTAPASSSESVSDRPTPWLSAGSPGTRDTRRAWHPASHHKSSHPRLPKSAGPHHTLVPPVLLGPGRQPHPAVPSQGLEGAWLLPPATCIPSPPSPPPGTSSSPTRQVSPARLQTSGQPGRWSVHPG